MPDLLIELLSEEIPPRMQRRAAADLESLMRGGFEARGLDFAQTKALSSPRRVAFFAGGLADASPEVREERRGPREGAPAKAIEGFARGAGVAPEALEIRDDENGRFHYATIVRKGCPAAQVVAEVLNETIRDFPWRKSMRWGEGSLRWVRPLKSILCILTDDSGGAETVELEIDGITAGNETEGHPVMGSGRFAVSSLDEYLDLLRRNFVMADDVERRAAVERGVAELASAAGMEVIADAPLLDEVAGLVEWPKPLMGEIGEEFLHLPVEVLQTSMREHQKFFSVHNPASGRVERFIAVANLEADDGGESILAGNIRVLRARLSDANFFWERDLYTLEASGLELWNDRLRETMFFTPLGTEARRVERIGSLAKRLALITGALPDLAEGAAKVCKAALKSDMVGEFPKLQGVMGRVYAERAGLYAEVAAACEEHYAPLGPSDAAPTAPVSAAVALADKIDMLTGFWAIGEKPTGSRDPFALRRAALGVIRIVLDGGFQFDLDAEIAAGLAQHEIEGGEEAQVAADLRVFFVERLRVHLRERGVRHDVIDACVNATGGLFLALLVRRAMALQEVLGTDDGENLVPVFRRVNNILTQAEEDGLELSDLDGSGSIFFMSEKGHVLPEETRLERPLDQAERLIDSYIASEKYSEAVVQLAMLRTPMDQYFDAVLINDDDHAARMHRLQILYRFRRTCLKVADFSLLEG